MNQINDLPTPSDFGLGFDYSQWSPGTVVTLCNVPWSADYRDVVYFESNAALDSYLDGVSGPRIQLTSNHILPPGKPVRIPTPFNTANRFNYLRVHNPATPAGDSPRTYYYFINDLSYVSPNTTELNVQVDVWQTYIRSVTLGNCYIERGHIGIANSKNFDGYGRDYLTIPEGLDIGAEHAIVKAERHRLITVNDTDPEAPGAGVLVTSTASLEPPYGTVDNPVLKTADGSVMEGLPNGCGIYYFSSVSKFKAFLQFMSDKPWVTNCIVSVMVVPPSGIVTLNDFWTDYTLNNPNSSSQDTPTSTTFYKLLTVVNPSVINLIPNFRDGILPSRYAHLKKFLTHPYMSVELTTLSGNPLSLKPELVGSNDLTVVNEPHYAPPSPRMMFYVANYNRNNSLTTLWSEEWLDVATGVTDFPTFSVPNNSYLSYMASNRNSISFQHSAADWSQQRATASAQLAFDQASMGMATNTASTTASQNAANAQTSLSNQTAGYRAATGAAMGIASGLTAGPTGLVGGAMGALGEVANYAISVNQNNQSTAISNNLMRTQTDIGNRNAGFNRDTNVAFARFAAQGDYENAIAGINAKVQDAKLIPPTAAGQIGGDAFNLARYGIAIYGRVRTLPGAAMSAIGEYWLRYGYAVHRFSTIPSDYQVMEKFTYWKLKETYIRSQTCPEGFRQAIRGIFEKGVTVWSNPDDIGVIDIGNNPVKAGVTL